MKRQANPQLCAPGELALAQIMGHDSLDTTRLYMQGTRHDLQQAAHTMAWT